MKKISIVIGCYNVSEYLDRCWASLKTQTIGIENIECIFVDDASNDGGKTWEVLQRIENEAPESVMIIHSEQNGGPGGARNKGIAYAGGKYLLFLDADDEFLPNSCEKLFELAEEKETDIIQFNHIITRGEIKKVNQGPKGNTLYTIETDNDRVRFLNATTVSYGCWNKLYRMDMVKESQAVFAEKVVYEEPLFVYPMFLYAKRIYITDEVFYIYNIHEGSIVTAKIGKKLTDHPQVQLMLLEYCLQRPDLFKKYSEVIECYFLWSYYCETIMFAAQRADTVLSAEYFAQMQAICLKLFPNWRENAMIKRTPADVQELMNSLYIKIGSQQELNDFIKHAGKL